jgi:glucokinase
VLTPEVIIIGGGVGASLHKFKGYLDNWLKALTPVAITVPPILEAQHPEEAVIYGCYELAKQRAQS